MESLLNKMYKKKQMQQTPAGESSRAAQNRELEAGAKKGFSQYDKEIDGQSMVSTQPSFVKEKPKEKVPLADTRKGRILDTAAAFIGLPHVCSNE